MIVIVAVFVLVGFMVPNTTHAFSLNPIDWVGNIIKNKIVNNGVEFIADALSYFVQYVIFWILGLLLGLAGMLMDNVLAFTDLKSTGVVQGWTILRDLVNMLFILVLLVVAFATVLNIQKYHVKDILPRLIVVALLINFSMAITFAVVDASQFLMYGFYNAMIGGLKGDCAVLTPGTCFSQMAMIKELMVDSSPTSTAGQAWVTLGNLVMGAIFLFVFTVVVVAGSLLLVVRIVGIWVAVIFSPFAFFSYMLPSLNKFAQTWLTKFLQYTFFGPIYVFFLWLSLILLQYVPSFLQAKGLEDYKTYIDAPVNNFVKYLGNVLQYIMVITLLLWSFMITRKLGIHYGEKIANGSEKFMKDAAWTVDRSVARGEIPFTGVKVPGLKHVMPYFSYGAQKRAWTSRKQEAERSSYSKATGAIEEKIAGFSSPREALRTIGGSIPFFKKPKRYYYETLRHQSEVSKKQNEISSAVKDEDQLVAMASTATDPVEKEALYRQMAATNAFNTYFANQGMPQNFTSIQKHLRETFDKKEGARIGAELAALGIGSGNYTWAGMTKWDKKKGMMFGDIKHHENIVKSKMRELEPQRFMAGLHPDSIFDRNKDGTFGSISDTGRVILGNLTGMHLDQFNRMQGRDLVEMTRKISDVRGVNSNAASSLIDTMFPDKKFPGGIPTLGGNVDRDEAKRGLHDAAIMSYINETYK